MAFRDSILAISPAWLQGLVNGGIQYCTGLSLDAIELWKKNGVRASMPGYGVPDALYLIGRDMQIDRGPNETDAHYITRLQQAIDSWRTAGAAATMLQQLAAYWSPSVATPIRLVSNAAVWHEINLTTGVVTQTNVGTNWNWDGNTAKWFRGWVIIDSSAGPWANDGLWGSGGLWGDGGTWGSTMRPDEVQVIRNWIAKWKPANVAVEVIVTFDATILTRAATSPPNPSGTSNSPAWRAARNAAFWGPTS